MLAISETALIFVARNFVRFREHDPTVGRGEEKETAAPVEGYLAASGRFVDCNYVQVGGCTIRVKEGGRGSKKGSETKVVGVTAGNRMGRRGMTA